jgi:acetyltransferase-like isoleucine patch superfamily enzyme
MVRAMKPALTFVLFDVVFAALFVVVVGVPCVVVAALLHACMGALPLWLAPVLLAPAMLVFVVVMALVTFAVRVCLPRLRPGRYAMSHLQGLVWGAHFALQRIASLPAWKFLAFGTYTTRYLWLRALGARVPYALNTASDTQILDAQLHTIGAGAMVAAGCVLGGHLVEDGHLRLGSIVIGKGAQILEGAKIGPDVTVGEDAVVGAESRIPHDVVIGTGAHLGGACVLLAGVRVGEHAVLGLGVVLESHVHIGDGAVVASHTVVPRGTHVDSGARFPPRPPVESP